MAVPSIRLPHQPRLPLLQPLVSSCPVGPAGSSQEALPSVPAACKEEAGGPWPCQGDQILSTTCCFH